MPVLLQAAFPRPWPLALPAPFLSLFHPFCHFAARLSSVFSFVNSLALSLFLSPFVPRSLGAGHCWGRRGRGARPSLSSPSSPGSALPARRSGVLGRFNPERSRPLFSSASLLMFWAPGTAPGPCSLHCPPLCPLSSSGLLLLLGFSWLQELLSLLPSALLLVVFCRLLLLGHNLFLT